MAARPGYKQKCLTSSPIDRHKDRLAKQGLRFHSVLNFEQITNVLEEAGRISADQAHELRSPTH